MSLTPAHNSRPFRVLILSTDIGEGHDAAARALTAQLEREYERIEVECRDGLKVFPWSMRILMRDLYRFQVRYAPWSYALTYSIGNYFAPARALLRSILCLRASGRLLRLIRKLRPDVVVSTYPMFTVVLGSLRKRGRLNIPAYATVTDLTGLMFWAHPGIDQHFVMYEESVPLVEEIAGSGSATQVQALVSPQFLTPLERSVARSHLGLPGGDRIVLVSGGGWGCGDLPGAIKTALAHADTTVICLTGKNGSAREQLEREFGAKPRVRILGFTDQMKELMAAADAVIHPMAGVTCLEAQTLGLPVIAYAAPAGHALDNARTMARLGLVEAPETEAELKTVLERTLKRPRTKITSSAPSAASLITRPTEIFNWRGAIWRARALRAAAVSVSFIGAVSISLSTEPPYNALANALKLRPISSVATATPEVGLVISAPTELIPTVQRRLSRSATHASFAFRRQPDERTLHLLRERRDGLVPQLTSGTGTRWLRTRGWLRREAKATGTSKSGYYYLAPPDGATIGQYLMARSAGAHPIYAAAQMAVHVPRAERPLRRGQIVLVALTGSRRAALEGLDSFLDRLERQHLHAIPVDDLMCRADHLSTS